MNETNGYTEPASYFMAGRDLLEIDAYPAGPDGPAEPTIVLNGGPGRPEILDLTATDARTLAAYLITAAEAAERG